MTAACILFFLLFLSRFSYAPLFALLFGIVLGFLGLHPLDDTLKTVATLALVFYLFVDSTRLRIPVIFHFQSKRLPVIGLVITFAATFFLLKGMFAFSNETTLLCILPLLVIDGKTTPSIYKCTLPPRIREMTLLESSFTGILVALLLTDIHLSSLLSIAIGGAGGFVFAKLPLKQGIQLLIPFALYALCKALEISPFPAVITGGLTFGHTKRLLIAPFFDLSRRYGILLYYALLIFFGTFALHTLSQNLNLSLIAFAFLFLIGIRFIAVFFSFLKTPYEWKTTFYFTFMGPKGLVAIALLFLIPFPQQPLITLTLFLSIILHSLLAPAVIRTYGAAMMHRPDTAEHLPTIILP